MKKFGKNVILTKKEKEKMVTIAKTWPEISRVLIDEYDYCGV